MICKILFVIFRGKKCRKFYIPLSAGYYKEIYEDDKPDFKNCVIFHKEAVGILLHAPMEKKYY